jgi:2-amino-4-hydroxy-6-hydroxymethyldihydropteridine diphosphokinase
MVVEVRYSGDPEDLLAIVIQVEKVMGRLRSVHWGPRIIDVDILVFGQQLLTSQRLSVPHPMLAKRAFVLVPWAEIAPDFQIAGLDATVSALLARLPESERTAVRRITA